MIPVGLYLRHRQMLDYYSSLFKLSGHTLSHNNQHMILTHAHEGRCQMKGLHVHVETQHSGRMEDCQGK